jgi:predicted glycosyltransferase
LLAARGYFDLIEPQDLKPEILIERVLNGLQPNSVIAPSVDLEGLPRIRERASELLEGAVA